MAPGLVRKVLVFAAIDGLVLQPLGSRGQRTIPATKIAYKDNNIGPVLADGVESDEAGKSFEAFGVVGLLKVSKSSFLISITRRQQVAQIQGKPIYVVTEVTLTPLASHSEAEASIINTQAAIQRRAAGGHGLGESDTDGDEEEFSATISEDVDDEGVQPPPADTSSASSGHQRTSSVAEDVMKRKGSYGRFAQKWFSRKGWAVDQRRNLGMAVSESGIGTPDGNESGKVETLGQDVTFSDSDKNNDTSIRNQQVSDVAAKLLPKLLRTTQILFGSSQSFFFSYDFDITRSVVNRRPTNDLPLHTQVDPTFFWNRNIIEPFIDAGQTSLVLPLMQGFVGQQSFEMDSDPPKPVIGLDGDVKSSMELVDMSAGRGHLESTDDSDSSRSSGASKSMKSFLLTLISRRSVQRAGLRYLRRGTDEEGFTANTVETEQVLSDSSWTPSNKIYSFVQIRGSVPIFFSQSPYSFKPVPQLQHSEDMNYRAFVKHFTRLSELYGNVQIASLVEKHGNEAIVGESYEMYLSRYNEAKRNEDSPVGFEWFDFHVVCRGMRFENVSSLFEEIGKTLDEFGDTVQVDGKLLRKQTGVLRTNCMDCLDRTNVTQSACGRRALELQLKSEGIDMSLQADQTTQWFNTLWADNGDSISKQYASTAAMKGDFTRNRKRDFQGALKDMGISISRFYSGIVNDYFSQAAIDFLLGNVSSVVFEEFESNLMSGDPAVSMPKLREQAIEMCQKMCVPDEHEELVGGWTLLTPQTPDTVRSSPFEESVLLLTDVGLYSCRFDWNLEKVSSFERVDLQHISSIRYGTYITSTLSAAQADEQRNVGIVVTYSAGADDITRVNSRSLSNIRTRNEAGLLGGTSLVSQPSSALEKLIGRPAAPVTRVLALKALSTRSAVAAGNETQMSEIEQVKAICSEIERMILHGQVVEVGTERKSIVESGDIISLSEARKSTGLLEQLGHSLKKLVWA